jgi:hypothetical protein
MKNLMNALMVLMTVGLTACGAGGGGSNVGGGPTAGPTPPPGGGGGGSLSFSDFTLSMGNFGTMTPSGGSGSYSFTEISGSSYATVASNLISGIAVGNGQVMVSDGTSSVTANFKVKGANSIMVSSNTVCGNITDSTTQCFGIKLDYATPGFSNTPATSSVYGTFSSLAQGTGSYSFSCVVSGGLVGCSGDNSVGELGNGSAAASSTIAVQVTGLTNITKVVAGDSHACALKSDGTLYCWGNNQFLQIGNGSGAAFFNTPQAITFGSAVVDVAAYYRTTCALLFSGAVQCWGRGADGQLGNGSYSNSGVPVTAIANSATSISVGQTFACAGSSSGVKCWGDNSNLQLGNLGASGNSPVSANNIATAVASLSSSSASTCALLTSGKVYCWGINQVGQIGDSTSNATEQPVQIFASATDVQMGRNFGCARFSDKSIKCWGSNQFGQLGKSTTAVTSTSTPGVPTTNWQ